MGKILGSELRALLGEGENVTLPSGRSVHVRPFTFAEYALMDRLEPDVLAPVEYDGLRLFVLLHADVGFEVEGATIEEKYASWKTAYGPELHAALEGVRLAVERANAKFRHREPVGSGSVPDNPGLAQAGLDAEGGA